MQLMDTVVQCMGYLLILSTVFEFLDTILPFENQTQISSIQIMLKFGHSFTF